MQRQRGFILLAILGLVGWLAGWLLLTTAWLGQSRRAADQQERAFLLEHYAEQALDRGQAQLQRLAGEDTVATARAAILGDVGQPRWVGVWNHRTGTGPHWLVSGAPADPDAALTEAARFVLGDGSEVLAPAVSLGRAGREGRLEVTVAWWIDDESLKASLRPPPQYSTAEESLRHRLEGQSASAAWLPVFFSNLAGDALSDPLAAPFAGGFTRRDFLGAIATPNELREAFAGFSPEEFREQHAHLTLEARGVLANSAEGGLRHELLAAHPEDNESPLEDGLRAPDVRDFLTTGLDFGNLTPRGAEDVADPGQTVGLISTEWSLSLGFYRDRFRGTSFVFGLRIDAWNPWSRALAFSGRDADNPDWRVTLEDFPLFTLTWDDGFATVHVGDALGEIGVDLWGDMAGGEVRRLWTPGRREFLASEGFLVGSEPNVGDTVTLAWPAALVDVVFRTADGDLLQRLEDVPLPPGERTLFLQSERSLPPDLHEEWDGNSREPGITYYSWIWHHRWKLPTSPEENPFAGWFHDWQPLDLILFFDADRWEANLFSDPLDPGMFSPHEVFHRQASGTLLDRERFPMRTHPLAPVTTVGALSVWDSAVGAPGTSGANRVLDQAFLIGLEEDNVPTGAEVLPQARYRPLEGSWPEDRAPGAPDILVSGAFNVNSTSALAWEAVLRGRNLFRVGEGGQERSYAGVSGGLTFDIASDIFSKSPDGPVTWWQRVYAHDLRELDGEAARGLAEAIVRRLQLRGAPFPSLAAFADSGLLEAAIADAGLNRVGEEVFPLGAPARTSQADLLIGLAPFVFTRGDTFTIHASVQLRDAETGTMVGQRTVVRRVQRLPQVESSEETLQRVFAPLPVR